MWFWIKRIKIQISGVYVLSWKCLYCCRYSRETEGEAFDTFVLMLKKSMWGISMHSSPCKVTISCREAQSSWRELFSGTGVVLSGEFDWKTRACSGVSAEMLWTGACLSGDDWCSVSGCVCVVVFSKKCVQAHSVRTGSNWTLLIILAMSDPDMRSDKSASSSIWWSEHVSWSNEARNIRLRLSVSGRGM